MILKHHAQPPDRAGAIGEKILHLRSQDSVQCHQRTLSNWTLFVANYKVSLIVSTCQHSTCFNPVHMVTYPKPNASNHQDWAKREAPMMRACLVHALVLTKRTCKAKSPTIQFLKNFITKPFVQSTGQVSIAPCRHKACKIMQV